MNKVTLLLTLLWFSAGVVSAQSSDVPELTLQDCIKIALENNSTLRVAQKQEQIAGTNVTSATSAWLPSINTSFSSGRYFQGARRVKTDVPIGFDESTGQFLYKQLEIFQASTERNSHSARVSLNQNIFDFGQTLYSIKSNKAIAQASEQNVVSTRQAVIYNVKRAYYELLKAMRLETVYQEAADLAQEEVNRAQTMMDIGISSQAEVFQAKVSFGNARTSLITQKNAVDIAIAQLNNALGRDPGMPVAVKEDPSEPVFPVISFDEAVKTAIQNNSELKALNLQAKSSQYALRMAQSRYMPVIGANVTYSRNNDDISRVYTSKLDEDFTASLGIGMDLNIFNGFADKANSQRARLNHQVDLENLAERKRTLTAEVRQYFLQLQAYKDFIEINQQNIEAARENLRLQQEKRRVGSGTELEVSQAQVELTRAQANLVQAEYEAKTAKAQLEATMGMGDVTH